MPEACRSFEPSTSLAREAHRSEREPKQGSWKVGITQLFREVFREVSLFFREEDLTADIR
ncbi:hypothetical protein D7024_04550 [Desulfofundulus salinus]|uniref:Uncharacterized protein n=1 Tax=Desulfofundulus salinus TaxID=2419843 RepID=A0A494X029_9FIRM|nr:hypothetical protein D7024_04550 [Desulfofundulus salinum]